MRRGALPPVISLHLGARGHRCGGGAVIVSVLGVTLPYCRGGEGPLPQPPPHPQDSLGWDIAHLQEAAWQKRAAVATD